MWDAFLLGRPLTSCVCCACSHVSELYHYNAVARKETGVGIINGALFIWPISSNDGVVRFVAGRRLQVFGPKVLLREWQTGRPGLPASRGKGRMGDQDASAVCVAALFSESEFQQCITYNVQNHAETWKEFVSQSIHIGYSAFGHFVGFPLVSGVHLHCPFCAAAL